MLRRNALTSSPPGFNLTSAAAVGIVGLLVASGLSTAQQRGVEAITPLLSRFPHGAQAGPVTVYSDIGSEFSKQHAVHAERVWRYFAKVFRRSPGEETTLYYTRDKDLYLTIARHTPFPEPLPNARWVTALWDRDHRIWFIVPYREPDFGTQIHELSHDFLYATYPGSAAFPWILEGTGMYWESGRWDPGGDLVVEEPVGSFLRDFKSLQRRGELLPLAELLTLGRDRFWDPAYPAAKTYGQSMVLIHYLMKNHSGVMADLFSGLNLGRITDNGQLLEGLLRGLEMDLTDLEKRYAKYGASLRE